MTAARKDPESSKVAKKNIKSHTYNNKTFNDWYMTYGRKKGRSNLQGISEE